MSNLYFSPILFMALVVSSSAMSNNLVVNPSFEEPAPGSEGCTGGTWYTCVRMDC